MVANRIAVIHDGSDVSSWKHVESKLNPADDASRGMSVDSIIKRSRWSMGPGFLNQPEKYWPVQPDSLEPMESDHPEVKKSCVAVSNIDPKPGVVLEPLAKIVQRFSSWYHLKKCVSWLLRYRSSLQKAVKLRKLGTPRDYTKTGHVEELNVDELNHAETYILRSVQDQVYRDELKCQGKVKKSSSLFKLDPVMINGLLRVGGRIKHAPINDSNKHQIILPKNHHVCILIIRHYHELSGHSGQDYVLSRVRDKYWIIHGRTAVRRVLADCVDCKRRQAKVGEQKMADLPRDRLEPNQPAFTSVGVDFFGPFWVKRGRSQVKRYGCIYTCLTMRAVHIEITHSLDTDSFLNSLRRFIARRGEPSLMRSDNGGCFVSGNKELQDAIAQWNHEAIHHFFLKKGIKWMFNPPTASHHGGIWERCIRTTRKILNALLKEQILDDEGLSTLMCEVESIINGRPLTTISDDPRDYAPLTPNHLLMLRGGPAVPPGVFRKEDIYCRRQWRRIQYLADLFWKRWVREYLPQLQLRQKWNYPRRHFNVGDVVLMVENCPRNSWPLGRIVEVMPGRDGLVRRVKVLIRGSLMDRPVNKCVLLEGSAP